MPQNTDAMTQSPWRVKDYRAWFVADTSSMIGMSIGGFAFTLVAYAVCRNVMMAGVVGTVFALCEGVGTLPGGHLVDHADRKRLMIAAGVGSFVVLIALVGALTFGWMTAPLLFGFAAVRGLMSGLFSSVTDVVLPQIVAGDQLTQAYSSNQARDASVQLFAKPLSGALYGFGPEIPFLVSAVLYAIMAITSPLIKADLDPRHDTTVGSETAHAETTPSGESKPSAGSENGESHLDSVTAGLRWFIRWPQAMLIALNVAFCNCLMSLMISFVVLDQQTLNTPGWLIGVISTGSGAGMLLGSLLVGPMISRFRGGRVVQISLIVTTVGFTLMMFTRDAWLLAVCTFIAFLTVIPCNSVMGSYFDLIIPNALRGRVFAVFSLFSTVLGSLASALAGVLLHYCGYQLGLGVASIAMIAVMLMSFLARGIREIPFRSAFADITPWPLN